MDRIFRIGVDTSKTVFRYMVLMRQRTQFCARSCAATGFWSFSRSWHL